jgi:hypothetical protein
MGEILSLEQASSMAQDPSATDEQLLCAADALVSWGHVDQAEHLLNRLGSNRVLARRVNRLMAAARQLRRSGVLTELSALQAEERSGIDGPKEAYLARCRHGTRKVIIVFTGIDSRFWLSLMLLHGFLKRLPAHIIYLKDLRQYNFFDGLASIATGYDGLLKALRRGVQALGADDVHVLAISAGGFAGLRYAMGLKAKSFLGMSIRSDFSERSLAGMDPFFRREELRRAAPNMFMDLKPLLARSCWPERIILYCGENNSGDRYHSERLADLPNVEINLIKKLTSHNVISALLANGTFEQVLAKFISAKSPVRNGSKHEQPGIRR